MLPFGKCPCFCLACPIIFVLVFHRILELSGPDFYPALFLPIRVAGSGLYFDHQACNDCQGNAHQRTDHKIFGFDLLAVLFVKANDTFCRHQ